MNTKILFTLLFFSHFAQAFVTYGSGDSCDYKNSDYTIQDLIDLGEESIRVTNQINHLENLEITTEIVNIYGGFNNCDDAENNVLSDTKTVIDGSNSAPVISINAGSDLPHFVTLENLLLRNGKNVGFHNGGGISVFDLGSRSINVTVRNSLITQNTGTRGGGVFLNGVNVKFYAKETLILSNTASGTAGGSGVGGGLYCSKGQIQITQDSGISSNQAFSTVENGGHGGGVYLTQACSAKIETGTTGGVFDFRGISYNSASGHGGGLYAGSNAQVFIDSRTYNLPVNISHNTANSNGSNYGDGGGIYLSGNGTNLQAIGLYLNDNTAINGAGAAVNAGSLLTMSAIFNDCWDRKNCNMVSGNEAFGTNEPSQGGAFFIPGGSIGIRDAHIKNNNADEGVVVYAENAAQVHMIRSFIFKNGDFSTLNSPWDSKHAFLLLDSDLNMLHVTTAFNDVNIASIKQDNGEHYIVGSILFEPSTNQTGSFIGSTGFKDCLLVHNNFGLQGMTNSYLDAPNFVDSSNDDYHISADSAAIDKCTLTVRGGSDDDYDIDGELAPFDFLAVNNGLGTYDIGADEYRIESDDIIFSNGFE